MHLLILGGTGPCGIALIQQALAAHHTIVIYARSANKIPSDIASNPSVTIVTGQLTDSDALNKAMVGVHAVLSALGPPVSKGVTYPSNTPIAHGYEVIIDAMRKNNVKRIIVLGTASIKDPADKFSVRFAALISGVALFAHNAYRDVVEIGNVIREKNQDLIWTIARVPVLVSNPSTAVHAGYVGDGKDHTTLSREAFASFFMHELENNEWCRKAPLISSP
ncbi:NAD-P-binding protein [Abortiporus biennis]|nr:NAD-P-binding protein [Abortiporus biennis]